MHRSVCLIIVTNGCNNCIVVCPSGVSQLINAIYVVHYFQHPIGVHPTTHLAQAVVVVYSPLNTNSLNSELQ